MYEKTRGGIILGSGICWVIYCICMMTGQYFAADIFSPLCALLSAVCIALTATYNAKFRWTILFMALGPIFWFIGDMIYFFNDIGIVSDANVVAFSSPVYRMTSYAYVIGILSFGFIQYTRKDSMRLIANALLFSVSTFIISVSIFEMINHRPMSFAHLAPQYFQGILVAMFIIVFFLVMVANRAKREFSFYGLMVLLSLLLYGVLDIYYMMVEATGGEAESPMIDALFLLSIVLLGLAYAPSSMEKLIEKSEKEEMKRDGRIGVVMAIVALIIGTFFFAIGQMHLSRFFVMLITALAYFLLSKTIEVSELNEQLVAQKEQELEEANEKLANVSVLDIQTGLKNRRAWDRYTEDYLVRNRGKRMILYSIDINFFKLINNTYGNKGGDLVLIEIGRRLRGIENATINAFRIDGNQFLVACEDEMNDVDAAKFADYILDILDRSFEINGKILRVTFSIGAAIYPDNTSEFENLMNCVESVRSTHSPNASTSTCAFFDSKIMPKIQREQIIKSKLQDLDYDEKLELHYQPQVLTETGQLIGMEALLRWKDEDIGDVSPAEFIPIAEKMGIMPALGEWIIREAALQIQQWNTTYGNSYVMGINISPIQFQDVYFTDTLFSILRALEIPAEWIDVELTESVALNSIVNSSDIIIELKEKGLSVSVDDFGTGYETFANMIYFNFDRVKIAKELIDNIVISYNAEVIVGAIINMAKGMSLNVIAEGVEDEMQLDILKKLGCEQIQGYHFGKPISASEFEETWLKNK